jgi:phage-related protein (TIGR01555 family)
LAAADGNEDDGTPGLGTLNAVATARRWARAFGGGAVYVLADDGRRAHEPLDVANLRKVHSLEPLDRHELVVSSYGIDPNDRATFNRPVMYSTAGSGAVYERIHASRIVPFQGNSLPMRVMLRNGGWGGSILDLVWAELRNYATTNDYVTEAVTLLSQGVFKSEHLASAIEAGDHERVISRVEAMRTAMGILGDVVLDKAGEDYEIKARSLAGIKDAADVVVNALVAATDMPRAILLGETPGGLNSGENLGELEAWYGHVGSVQPQLYEPGLRRLLGLLMLSRDGPTRGQLVPGWGIKWLPLWTLDEAERAQLELTRAQRRAIDIGQAGVVTADEARREPALVEVYGHDPTAPAPAPVVQPPGNEVEQGLSDDDELQPVPVADPSTIPAGEQLVGAAVVATRLGVAPSTIHAMAARGEFPAWRVGGRWRYALSLVERAVDERTTALRAVP